MPKHWKKTAQSPILHTKQFLGCLAKYLTAYITSTQTE